MAITKHKLFTMKISPKEKVRWRRMADDRELTLSHLVRSLLDDMPIRKVGRGRKPIIDVDPRLLFEVNSIGNNINQIARRLNSGEKFDSLILLSSIEEQLTEVIRAHKIYQ